LIGEPTGGTYCRVAGLQTPYNGIAILEFQDFAKFFHGWKGRFDNRKGCRRPARIDNLLLIHNIRL
jgi:hypothetical protein